MVGIDAIVCVAGWCPSCILGRVQRLPRDQHLVALDLPGHGDSTIPAEHDNVGIEELLHSIYEVGVLWEARREHIWQAYHAASKKGVGAGAFMEITYW